MLKTLLSHPQLTGASAKGWHLKVTHDSLKCQHIPLGEDIDTQNTCMRCMKLYIELPLIDRMCIECWKQNKTNNPKTSVPGAEHCLNY